MSHFSICIIAKNEEKTLPRLIQSLKEFQGRGGEIILVDNASLDNTVEVARSLGCKVTEAGERFITTIDLELAKKINKGFIIDDEKPILDSGDRLFDFASARNFAASLASNDMICTLDCDESYVKFDIDKINQFIKEGYEQFEYNFIFAHDQWGKPSMEFVQSKFYDRHKAKWEGIVHEVLQGQTKIKFLDRDIILLEHFQEQGKDHRGRYLTGLALDCYQNRDKDRQSHYLARELLWTGRPKSAINEFERHIAMNRWHAERAQSMIFVGDAYGQLNQPEKQVEWYNKAFYHDSSRREALMKIAWFYLHNKNYLAADVYATAAMEIGWVPYYANDRGHYTNQPHEILYRAKGWLGDIEGARKHLLKALEINPYHPEYLRDTKYYFEYAVPDIEGWMTFPELTWLYETGKKMRSVCEVGSWKGRSTHALLSSGTKVTAVDTFKGSEDKRDATNWLAKQEDIFETFKNNTKQFTNLTINRNTSVEAAKKYPDKSFDCVFIDAGHTYKDIKEDIQAWRNKARMILCGHDYKKDVWMGVVKGVDEEIGIIDGVADSIWYKYLVPKVSFIIPTLGRPEGLQRCLDSIKNLHYPLELIETIVIEDEPRLGVPKRVKQGVERSTGDYIVYASNDVEFDPDSLITAITESTENNKRLVAFDTGVRNEEGFICEHFLIKRDLIIEIGGEIFDTEIEHVGVDDLLWKKCDRRGEAMISKGKATHHHFSRIGSGVLRDEVIELGWKNAEKDREKVEQKLNLIPKIIWTIWLNDKKTLPPLVKKYVKTHDLEGYEHRKINLDNCFRNKYIDDAIKAKMWGKACDYLRCHYLIEEGGIYLDADVEVLSGKNFDSLLVNKIFAGRENNMFVNTAVLGAEKGSQVLKDHLKEVVEKFKGDDGLFFESSVELITPRLYKEARVLDPEYFYPYDHQQGTTNITDKTICIHHFLKSWIGGDKK